MKVISCALSPNTEADDVKEACRVLLTLGSWQEGGAIDDVETWFQRYLNASCAVSFDSGRSALLAILRSFSVGLGDEVLIQAFTCVAVPQSIRSAGATPVYADIDDSFNMDPRGAAGKITRRTKAIIMQHTFGVPAQIDAILTLAKKHNLIVIEDCAHSLGATYHGKRIGTLGDAAFFSFGRDKVISSVWGGLATIRAKWNVESAKLREFQERLPYPSHAWILQQLLHPIAFAAILPTYNMVIGKVMLEAMKRMCLISTPNPPVVSPRRYPNALAQLLVRQLTKLARYNETRRGIASYYHRVLKQGVLQKGAIYLRYPMLIDNRDSVIGNSKRHGVLLGNWYHNVIDPRGDDTRCPNAQSTAKRIIDLPTRVSQEDAKIVCNLIG